MSEQSPDRLESNNEPAAPWWKTGGGFVLFGFLGVAGFYLVTEHTAHLFGVLPFLLILSCPLMHLFHHHKHPASLPANAVIVLGARQEGGL
jgi:hypothetical protein